MDVGMLWLDDDKGSTLEEKILRAADYYHNKYGKTPNMCMVNRGQLEAEKQVGRIQVMPVQNVLRHHFWMGIKTI